MKKINMITKIISSFVLVSLLLTTIFFNPGTNISYAQPEKLEIGKIYHGFKLVEERELKDINSTGRIFYHEKSGAKLVQIDNEDENKAFSISFRTPVDNSKGMPHILEHVILNGGSEKYPVRQLFFEIMKGSLTKDLNGYTHPDRTTYPFSTMSNKEFANLMDIYLNIAFKPLFYKNEKIFKTDGWHYKIEDKNAPLEYNGVVYNEMKGATSSPDGQLFSYIKKSLYPDTNYAYESGGDPAEIPALSFEELKDFYDKYYHPSNCYIYIYGKLDIIEKLKYINDNYLRYYDKKDVNSTLEIQKPFEKRKECVFEYPISKEESEEDKSYITLNFSVGDGSNQEINTAVSIVSQILFNNPASPVVQKLNNAGFKNVYSSFFPYSSQPFLSIVAKDTNENMKEKFVDVLYSSLEDVVEKGLDKKFIKSTINSIELGLRQQYSRDSMTGFLYGEIIMGSWIYDRDPFETLDFEKSLSNVKTAIDKPYFEDLIKEYILDNNFNSLVVVKPKKGLLEEKNKSVEEELKKYKESLSEEELEKLINEYKELQKWNSTPNSEEALKTLPTLSVKDLKPEIKEYPTIEKKENGINVLHHPLYTNGIGNLIMYFDTSAVKQEQIPYINLLSSLLGQVDTKNYKYTELPIEEATYTSGISYNPSVLQKPGDNKVYYPKLIVSSYSTNENIPKMLELIGEEINNSVFDNKNRLKQLISIQKSNCENMLNNMPHLMTLYRNNSYLSPHGKYNEILSGISYYNFISELDKNFDNKYEEIVRNLNEVKSSIFNKNNLLIGFTGENKEYKVFKDNISTISKRLGNKKLSKQIYKFDFNNKNEAFSAPMDVSYNCVGFNFTKSGYPNNGQMVVLNNILQSDYLFNEIRIKGGAYGAFSLIINNSDMMFASYRDPNLKQTYNAFNGTVNYIKNFDMNEKDFEKHIISSLTSFYTPISNIKKGKSADIYYLLDIKTEDLEQQLNEVLNTKPEDIRNFAEMIEKGLKDNNITTIGNEKAIQENKNMFNSVENLFK